MSDIVQGLFEVAEGATRRPPIAHNFWKKHPRFHKFMFVVCILATIAFTVFLIVFAASYTPTQ